MTIRVRGRVTESGALECELPSGLPTGEARITIEIPAEDRWTQEELEGALRVEPLTGKEIVEAGLARSPSSPGRWAGGWERRAGVVRALTGP
jgi:hypothetical protein